MTKKTGIIQTPWFPRVFPFALFMAFIAVGSGVSFMAGHSAAFAQFDRIDQFILYPVKTVLVAMAIIWLWKRCDELDFGDLKNPGRLMLSTAVGVLVFVLWINMDWPFASMGGAEGFDPHAGDNPVPALVSIAFRLVGAAVVVPIFEELFWRSFILRYIINPEFTKVSVGTFTWMSFAASSVLFGLEHHLWLAGIMAGVFYSLLLYRTRSIAACILAHGITNLLLGIYVLVTGNWQFW